MISQRKNHQIIQKSCFSYTIMLKSICWLNPGSVGPSPLKTAKVYEPLFVKTGWWQSCCCLQSLGMEPSECVNATHISSQAKCSPFFWFDFPQLEAFVFCQEPEVLEGRKREGVGKVPAVWPAAQRCLWPMWLYTPGWMNVSLGCCSTVLLLRLFTSLYFTSVRFFKLRFFNRTLLCFTASMMSRD